MNPFNAPDKIRATKGDLIEFKRRKFRFFPYYHFAVYTCDCVDSRVNVPINRNVGDGITVGVDVLEDSGYSLCKIVEETIRKLCKYQRGCRVNNLDKEAALLKQLKPLDADKIVERARNRLRKKLVENYDLFTKNCEHFATWCRFGKEFSCQVNLFILKPIIFMCSLRARRHKYPNDMIIENVMQNEEIDDS